MARKRLKPAIVLPGVPVDTVKPAGAVLILLTRTSIATRSEDVRLTDGLIAQALGLSISTVQRALAHLETLGRIRRETVDGVRVIHVVPRTGKGAADG